MGRFIPTVVFLFLWIPSLQAQGKHNHIRDIIKGADSIWLISHEVTGVYIKNEQGQSTEVKIVELGKINQILVKKSVLLNDADKRLLLNLLERPSTSLRVEMARCFFGKHALIWKKGKKISFIDVSFSCRQLRTSVDVENSLYGFDNRKWKELEAFFKQNGIADQL